MVHEAVFHLVGLENGLDAVVVLFKPHSNLHDEFLRGILGEGCTLVAGPFGRGSHFSPYLGGRLLKQPAVAINRLVKKFREFSDLRW